MAKRSIDTDKLAQEFGLAPSPQPDSASASSSAFPEPNPIVKVAPSADVADSSAAVESTAAPNPDSDTPAAVDQKPEKPSRKRKSSASSGEDNSKGMFFRVDDDIWLAIGFASAAYGLTKREIINSALRQSLAHEISMVESMGKKKK